MLQSVHRHLVGRTGRMSSRAAVCEDTVAAGWCCCCSRPRLLRWLRGSLPVIVWVSYLLAGAAIFQAVEEPEAVLRQERLDNLTDVTNRTIVGLFHELLSNMNGTIDDTKQERILTELAINLKIISEEASHNVTRWGFMNSALFCMTVVSTIGYGFLAPKTQLGRGLCIIYALIGIPLNIVVMASAGKALTRGIRSMHGRLGRAAFWKKQIAPQTQEDAASPPTDLSQKGLKSPATGRAGDRVQGRLHLRTLSPIDLDCRATPGIQTIIHRGLDDWEGSSVRHGPRGARQDPYSTETINDPDFPAWVFVFFVLLYTCVFSMVMWATQREWTVLDSFYYIVITITTIGFGDLVTSETQEEWGHWTYYFVGITAIIIPVIGMILLSAGISIVVNQFGQKTKRIEELICGTSKTRG